MRLLRAWLTLVWITFHRLLWSLNTFMVMFPLAGAALVLLRWRRRLGTNTLEEYNHSFTLFSDVYVIQVFTLFLLPIVALAYATTSIGGDREDRTLLFLLIRPVPRWLILLAKVCATAPLVVGLTVGWFWLYCTLAGPIGGEAFRLYLPSVFLMALAYVAVFHLFAVMFRHSTIIALLYALFMEALVGNMPGVIKRLAVSFYGRSVMYGRAEPYGLEAPEVFEALSPASATWALLAITAGTLLVGMAVFQRREYRDLA